MHQLPIISSSVRLTNDETTGDDDGDVETTTCIASPIADVRGAKAADSKPVVTNTPRRATRATERYGRLAARTPFVVLHLLRCLVVVALLL